MHVNPIPPVLVGLFLLVTAGSAAAQTPVPDTADSVDCTSPVHIDWLLGNWETAGGGTVFRESWVRLTDDTWEGGGQMLESESGAVRSEEALRLVGMAGGLFYLAKVEHNSLPTAFAATECSESHVVFENPDHDFPKRIAYRSVDTDHVTVDVDDGAGRGFRLEFARAKE